MSKTAADRYVDAVVSQNIELREMAEGALDTVRARFAELLNDFAQCNTDIIMQFVEAEVAASDLPGEFWARVVDAQALAYDDMMRVPVEERGEAWEIAAAIKIAACRRQAMIERGNIHEAIEMGMHYGAIKNSDVEKISVAELGGKMDIAGAVKAELAKEGAQ